MPSVHLMLKAWTLPLEHLMFTWDFTRLAMLGNSHFSCCVYCDYYHLIILMSCTWLSNTQTLCVKVYYICTACIVCYGWKEKHSRRLNLRGAQLLHLSGHLQWPQATPVHASMPTAASVLWNCGKRPASYIGWLILTCMPNMSSRHTCSSQWSDRPPASISDQPLPGDHGGTQKSSSRSTSQCRKSRERLCKPSSRDKVKVICHEHAGKEVELFCETCGEPVCVKCACYQRRQPSQPWLWRARQSLWEVQGKGHSITAWSQWRSKWPPPPRQL